MLWESAIVAERMDDDGDDDDNDKKYLHLRSWRDSRDEMPSFVPSQQARVVRILFDVSTTWDFSKRPLVEVDGGMVAAVGHAFCQDSY